MADWKLDRMRRALRILEAQGEGLDDVVDPEPSSRRNSAWKHIRNNIVDFTGAEMGGWERLRQFAMGHPDASKPTGWHYPGLRQDRLEAVAKFLTDDDAILSPLPKIELESFDPALQAPLYLLEFFQQHAKEQRGLDPKQFEGRFEAEATTETWKIDYQLNLEGAVDDGLLLATMFEDRFDVRTPRESLGHADQTIRHQGWAVITPEDNLVVFLKARVQKHVMNWHLLSVAYDEAAVDGMPVMQLAAVCHDFPIQSHAEEGPDMLKEKVAGYLRAKTIYFDRVK